MTVNRKLDLSLDHLRQKISRTITRQTMAADAHHAPSTPPDPPQDDPHLIGQPPHSHWVYRSLPTGPTLDPPPPPPPLPPPPPPDMQNFFLSPSLGRDPSGPGHAAQQVLVDSTIPSCRKAGIQVVWLSWGVTDEDLLEMPASTIKGFGGLNAFQPPEEKKSQTNVEGEALVDTKPSRIYKGFGTPMGHVRLDDGSEVDAGRMLAPDQWNSSLPPPLDELYHQGLKLDDKPDVWCHKTRMSGLYDPGTPAFRFLKERGIKTLLFAGVNTDQCVAGTLVDAYNSGWDVVMVKDACGTGTPGGREVTEWNVSRSWGFLVESEAVEAGVEAMLRARK